MRIRSLEVSGYRSLRELRLPFREINAITAPNGCGKTNLYRSVVLLAEAARGRLARALIEEGGMPSALWAGARKKGPVRMRIAVELEELEYEIACGLPDPSHPGPFHLDPLVKEEAVWITEGKRRVQLLARRQNGVWARDREGRREGFPFLLLESESVLSQLAQPHLYPELSVLRQEILGWRIYHHFQTGPGSPLRQPHPGTLTPVLSDDGRDLAAALVTIGEIGDRAALSEAIESAFPGSTLDLQADRGRFFLRLLMPGIGRPLEAAELSDGTLRYLCLLAALLSPRPAPLLAFNEPEMSLHPSLLAPLALLMARAGLSSQLWITTHSEELARRLEECSSIPPIRLEKIRGETVIAGGRSRPGSPLERRSSDPRAEGVEP
jgi:predicted ATPase